MKKIKGHIIAKIILASAFAFFLIVLGVEMKSIDEGTVRQSEIETAQLVPGGTFDKVDIWMLKNGNKMYRVLQPMSVFVLCFWSFLISLAMVLAIDQIAGVGRLSPLFSKNNKKE